MSKNSFSQNFSYICDISGFEIISLPSRDDVEDTFNGYEGEVGGYGRNGDGQLTQLIIFNKYLNFSQTDLPQIMQILLDTKFYL